ncbi:hypothetical protein GKE82_07940 [Conexibacter sp. W3-3-2]|uniref:Uncharacterized protein n=1 Tax=Paraconexibacter algicola TaxID=2133960 RepID=A0A2T4UBV9_9ACTN|nr:MULTISPECIES: hypothetical protein [Solirubrobacterales]MTD44230.1 hypothetical protein [Conexibacter sp. W3-3-2]PTL54404.1 hypothetical protein C7Y72_21975 [Paraconexibacter algicola]
MFGIGIWSTIVLATGVLSVLAMFAYMATGHGVRGDEEAARDFYDEHGHWPDQTPEEAEAEREEAQKWARAQTSTADPDGVV